MRESILGAAIRDRFPRRKLTQDPATTLFGRIRWKLMLWYAGVLAVALVVFGVALYVGMSRVLLGPIDNGLRTQAADMVATRQAVPELACPPFGPGARQGELWACYDSQGQLITESRPAYVIPHFTNSSLALTALRSGQVADTVNSGGEFGLIRRYAVTVPDASGNVRGVVMVGTQVGAQIQALHVLLVLLLILGALVLLIASGGGLILANRALLPARLAHLRQRDFIADASHELRTPLTLMRADAEVLLRGRNDLGSDDAALLEDVVTEAGHLSALAANMLDLARLDAGEMRIEHEVVDLAQIATDVARRAAALALEQQLAVRAESDGAVLVIGDRLLLEQVLLVLVDNAMKYNHPGGEVSIQTWNTADQAHLTVRDTGIGIAPEHVPRLGERFYRVDKARSRATGGAGLGLSIARRIVARHRGTLRIDSTPGKGTAVTLSFPAARRASVP